MKVLKSFENRLGKTELIKYEGGTYAVKLECPNVIHNFREYTYRSNAVETFQFNCYWLQHNCKEETK